MRKWLLLIAAILPEVTATLSLRGALDHPALYVVVAVGYVGSFVALSRVLRAGMASASPTASGPLPVWP
ncbi:SMR family transporter [Streptomyces sp. KR55]|uniref:SMR family transporter n=1 Tax=Streptomyces sp. KR55 TaxID=3457425 RepID=UPI003FD67598